MKQSKGITLIALVITIIVLLILAGVAIATLTGDNGILTKAVQAKDATRGGEVKEYVEMALVENTMADNTNGTRKTRAEVISELSTQGKLTAEEVTTLADVDVITIGGIQINFGELFTLVDMYDKAIADNCTNKDGTCTNKRHLHIGDYVDYKNPTSGVKTAEKEKTGYTSNQVYEASKNQLNWRVLGKDSTTGGIKLISGRPMKSNNSETDPYLHLCGAKGYLNSETVLNDLCSLYTTQYGTARSVNRDDVNEITGITTEEKIKEFNKGPTWWGDMQYGETYNLENQYTPESYLDGNPQTIISTTVDGYAYTVNSGEDPIVRVTNTRAYNMLFDSVNSDNGEDAYWLATHGVNLNLKFVCANFYISIIRENEQGVGLVNRTIFTSSTGNGIDACYAVRPVLTLKVNITESEIPKIPDQTEET